MFKVRASALFTLVTSDASSPLRSTPLVQKFFIRMVERPRGASTGAAADSTTLAAEAEAAASAGRRTPNRAAPIEAGAQAQVRAHDGGSGGKQEAAPVGDPGPKPQLQSRLTCTRGGRCAITRETRTHCQSCRFQKCLQIGMRKQGARPSSLTLCSLHCSFELLGHHCTKTITSKLY